jgi:hypothetical protein
MISVMLGWRPAVPVTRSSTALWSRRSTAERCSRGLGLLFLARPVRSRPQWRVYLAFFAPVDDGSWLVLLPYHQVHDDPAGAQAAAEDLTARMHRMSWHQAVGLFAHPSSRTGPEAARTMHGAQDVAGQRRHAAVPIA